MHINIEIIGVLCAMCVGCFLNKQVSRLKCQFQNLEEFLCRLLSYFIFKAIIKLSIYLHNLPHILHILIRTAFLPQSSQRVKSFFINFIYLLLLGCTNCRTLTIRAK